ncbi:hypothetical protein [Photobacterium leiognathi]|uniref:hypothetical protein n=1 Tax=Photobacterium leiognathi TaxID=553611 RepID=UPI002980E97D|nr:hypothetical protein [Photobacterium leiognathi]
MIINELYLLELGSLRSQLPDLYRNQIMFGDNDGLKCLQPNVFKFEINELDVDYSCFFPSIHGFNQKVYRLTVSSCGVFEGRIKEPAGKCDEIARFQVSIKLDRETPEVIFGPKGNLGMIPEKYRGRGIGKKAMETLVNLVTERHGTNIDIVEGRLSDVDAKIDKHRLIRNKFYFGLGFTISSGGDFFSKRINPEDENYLRVVSGRFGVGELGPDKIGDLNIESKQKFYIRENPKEIESHIDYISDLIGQALKAKLTDEVEGDQFYNDLLDGKYKALAKINESPPCRLKNLVKVKDTIKVFFKKNR